ncbi:hypothetical protein B551_0222655 [Cupriavidus sp. HPC(L)]|uniref:hypothetical protein n=1 Tax=Cupriavidus sp. HPC(L) TaxID=1217418 RepID=UPI0002917F9A|nr:hypothetical protein [Cupriavidus sp. HPC(L)]ESH90773.1 hypothetical protein B551_0222655 [Cupriavidus sp. HPC(L)]
MSAIEINRSEVNEVQYSATLGQVQIEGLIAEAVAKAAGVDLASAGVRVKKVELITSDKVIGFETSAACEIVVDRLPAAPEETAS